MIIKDWIKNYKITTVGIIIGLIVAGLLGFIMLVSLQGARNESREAAEMAYQRASLQSEAGEKIFSDSQKASESAREIEVKEGMMKIKSEGAETDFVQIKSMVENYQGYAERSSKSVTNLYIRLDLTLRVPSESFAGLVEKLKEKFEV